MVFGRLTESRKLFTDIVLPPQNPQTDRATVCGSPQMLADISALLDRCGFRISPRIGEPGQYVTERAFVEK